MKVRDILEKMSNQEKGEFKFYVNYTLGEGSSREFVNWTYKDGLVMGDDESGFHWCVEHIYNLDNEIVVIEEDK